jgi:peptide/nickel transport system permease protein
MTIDEIQSATSPARPAPPGLPARIARLARQNVIGMIGAAVVALVILVAVCAPLLTPYEPSSLLGRRLQGPSARFLFGTDELGRDVFTRVIYGTRISLYVGLIAVGLGVLLGGLVGVVSGYFGGLLDSLLMRVMDILLAFPGLVLAIVIAGMLGPSTTNAMIAIGIVYLPSFARIARGSVLAVKAEP